MPVLPSISALAARKGLRLEHPARVRAEAAEWVADPGIDDPELVDLLALPFVTIDEYTSRDLDQAVHVARTDIGWRVHYAIADAAHFAPPRTALFREALARGATYYLPGLIAPMLPPELSEDLVSLNPDVVRRAMVFRVDVDRDGTAVRTEVLRARIRSVAKLAFEQVQAFYDGGPPPAAPESLEALAELGRARLERADERDVLRLRRTELAVGVQGLRFVAEEDLRLDVERYNEQVSVLCNVEGARLLADGHPDVHPIFRIHEPPQPQRLTALREAVDAIARAHDAPDHAWSGGESLASFLAALPTDRVSRAIHRAAMRSGGRAAFSAIPGRHHGIGADVYARFTAPMREIVGVFVHKEAWERLGLMAPHDGDEQLREDVIAASDRARQLQRELDHEVNRLVLDQLFLTRSAHVGTVMGATRSKLHIQLDDPPVDAKSYVSHFPGARVDGVVAALPDGVVRVGDAVRVRVEGTVGDRWRLRVFPA